jgi:hypothetical protein
MLSEQEAVEAAKAAFFKERPNAALREITWFTVNDGLTWTVHFRRPTRVEVNEETGFITETVESNDSWILCVDSETGRVYWIETL